MFAVDFVPVTIPPWVERVALPKYPIMPLAGHVMLGLGALVLLIGYFAPIKKLPALLAALSLMVYYPLSYLSLWFLFRYDEQQRALREPNKFEEYLFNHTVVLDWSILGICAFFGFVYLLWTVIGTVRKRRRMRQKETAGSEQAFPARPIARAQPAVARSVAPRPAAAPPAPQVRKVPKKPGASPPSDNPFDFG